MAVPFAVAKGVPPAVAKVFQSYLDHVNEYDPPRYDPPPLITNMRHACESARLSVVTGKGISTAIDLKERYVTGDQIEEDWSGMPAMVLDDSFALIYKEGKCKRCGEVARSSRARIVVTAQRPPVSGRVAREG